MICTSVVPCSPVASLKLRKLYPCLSYFPKVFGHFESSALIKKKWEGVQPHTKAVKQDVCSQFLKVQQSEPGLHIVVTIAEHACDHVLKRILKLPTCRLQIILVKYDYLRSLLP